MNSATDSQLYRSEAFAEDVYDLVCATPTNQVQEVPPRWLVNAVVPPLT